MLPEYLTNHGLSRFPSEEISDDQRLWETFKNGNELAFTTIYKRHVKDLYSFGMHFCQDDSIVQDCIQELFTVLWQSKAQLSPVKSIKYYLISSFRRKLIKSLNLKRKLTELVPEKQFLLTPSQEELTIENERDLIRIERLNHAIRELSARQREAVYLKFKNGLSYQEVAHIMDMKVDSVYNLISKAIHQLRHLLTTQALILVSYFMNG